MAAIPPPAPGIPAYLGLQAKQEHHIHGSASNRKASVVSKEAEAYGSGIPDPANVQERSSDDDSADSIKEVFAIDAIDPVLARKMALVNRAIDEIGMTGFQWKMFYLNGFGYAVDSAGLA